MEAFYADPMKAVCEDNFLRLLNMSDAVPVGDIQRSICDTDWEQFGQELMETMDWMGSMQKVGILYEPCREKMGLCRMRASKAQISRHIHAVWSAPLSFTA